MANEQLRFLVEVDTAEGVASLRRFTGQLEATGSTAAKVGQGFTNLQAKINTLSNAYTAVSHAVRDARAVISASFNFLIGDAAKLGDQMLQLSRRFGVPVEQLERLRFAAGQAGVSLEALAPSFRSITQALTEAGKEGSDAQQVFRNLGLADEVERLKTLDPATQFLTIGRALNRFADDANKASAAQAVFGRGVFAAMQLLRDPDLAANLQKQGNLTREFAERADRLHDAFGELSFAWTNFKIALADTGAIDAITRAIKFLTRALEDQDGVLNRMARITKNLFTAGVPVLNIPGEAERRQHAREQAFRRPLAAHEETRSVADLESFLEGQKPRLPGRVDPAAGRAAAKALEEYTEKLTALRKEVLAGLDPVAQFRAEVEQQAQAMIGSAKVTAEQREELEGLVAANLRTEALKELGNTVRELGNQLTTLRDPSQQAAVATRTLAEDLQQNLGLSLDTILTKLPAVPPEVAAVTAAFVALSEAIEQKLDPETIRRRLQEFVGAFQVTQEAIEADRLGEIFRGHERDLRVFRGEITETEAKVEDLVKSLKAAGAVQGPRAEPLEEYARAVVQAQEGLKGFFDIFEALGEGWNRFLTSVAEGTLEWEEIGESIKASLVRNFSEAFAEAFREKLKFEGGFRVNLVQFLGNIGGIISGGTGGQGLLGALFQGVFGGGTTQLLSSLGGGLGRVPLLGSGLRALGFGGSTGATVGGGVPHIPTGGLTQPLLGRVGSFLGLGGAATGGIEGFITGPGGQLIPIYGPQAGFTAAEFGLLHPTFVGPPGPAELGAGFQGQAAGLLGNLGTLVAAIGALVAIGQGIKAIVENTEGLNKLTLGDASVGRFQTASALGLGIGTATGAGVGAVAGTFAFPGIGTVAGALIGAAIGAALSTAISNAVASGVGGGVAEARKQGLSQAGLEKEIRGDTGLQILYGTGKGGFNAGFAAPLFGQELLDLFIPNIETIFDKLFAQVLQKLNFPVNRQLGGAFGEGVPRTVRQVTRGPEGERLVTRVTHRQELEELRPLRQDAKTFAQIIADMIGAGRDNAERITRWTHVIVNSLAQQGKTLEQGERVLFRAFRQLSDFNFTKAFQLIERTFPVLPERRIERREERVEVLREAGRILQAERQERQVERLRDRRERQLEQRGRGEGLLGRAFQPVFAPVNVPQLVEIFRETREDFPGAFRRRGRRASREVVREAAPELLRGATAEEGIVNFTRTLAQKMTERVSQGLSDAIAKSFIGDALAPFFNAIDKDFKKIIKSGFTQGMDALRDDLKDAAEFLKKIVTVEGFKELVETLRDFQEQITLIVAQAQIAVGDRVGAVQTVLAGLPPVGAGDQDAQIRQMILDRLEPLRQAVERFRQLAEEALAVTKDLRRLAAPYLPGAIGGGGGELRAEREGQQERLAAAGVTIGPGGVTFDRERIRQNPEEALSAFQAFGQAAVAELTAGIAAGRRAGQFRTEINVSTGNLLGRYFPTDPAAQAQQLAALRSAREGAGAELAAAGITFGPEGVTFDMEKIADDAGRAERLLEEFSARRLEELQSELELLQQQEEIARQIRTFFTSLLQDINVIRFGQRGQAENLQNLQNRAVALRPAALAGDTAAIEELQRISQQALVLATQVYAPGSAELATTLDFWEQIGREFVDKFQPSADTAARIEVLKGEIITFREQAIAASHAIEQAVLGLPEKLATLLDNLDIAGSGLAAIFREEQEKAQRALEAEFQRIYDALAGLGDASILGVLTSIRDQLFPEQAEENQGVISSGQRAANLSFATQGLTGIGTGLGKVPAGDFGALRQQGAGIAAALHPQGAIVSSITAATRGTPAEGQALLLAEAFRLWAEQIPTSGTPEEFQYWLGQGKSLVTSFVDILPARAMGGPLAPGPAHLVGEAGRAELWVPSGLLPHDRPERSVSRETVTFLERTADPQAKRGPGASFPERRAPFALAAGLAASLLVAPPAAVTASAGAELARAARVLPAVPQVVGRDGPEIVRATVPGMILPHGPEDLGTAAEVQDEDTPAAAPGTTLGALLTAVTPRQQGGPLTPGTLSLVGERGVETYLPARRDPPASTRQDVKVELSFENTFQINGSQSPEKTGEQCALVLQRRLVPRLVAEVRRAVSS